MLASLSAVTSLIAPNVATMGVKARSNRYSNSRRPLEMNAAAKMIIKSKKKEVAALRSALEEAADDDRLKKFLATGELDNYLGAPIKFSEAAFKSPGTISVMPEYNLKVKTGFIFGLPGPEIMGGVLRDAGSKAIVACMDGRTGGVSSTYFGKFVREQDRARLFLPGPIPVVWNDFVVDKLQVANAAANGAAAITLYPDMVESIKELKMLVEYSAKMGVEVLVMANSEEQAQMAVQSGAEIICLHQMEERRLLATKEATEKAFPDHDLSFVARLRAESEFTGYAEIDNAWALRDAGFKVVWPSCEAIYCMGMLDLYPTISAMKSKSAKEFISPRQFLMDRKKEGATEFLGDILY